MANKDADGGSKKVIIIAVVAVLIIAIGAGAAVFFMMNQNKKEEEISFYSPGEYFVTNLKESNSLLKVTVTIGYNDKKATKDLEANNAVIRNSIVFVLRSKTKEQMQADDIETTLSNDICQKLNSELGVEYFVKVYFSDLVIQG